MSYWVTPTPGIRQKLPSHQSVSIPPHPPARMGSGHFIESEETIPRAGKRPTEQSRKALWKRDEVRSQANSVCLSLAPYGAGTHPHPTLATHTLPHPKVREAPGSEVLLVPQRPHPPWLSREWVSCHAEGPSLSGTAPVSFLSNSWRVCTHLDLRNCRHTSPNP